MNLTKMMNFSMLAKSRAEQSRAEQSRAEQSRAEQSRAEQSRGRFHNFIGQKFLNKLGKWLASMVLVVMSFGTQNAFAGGVPQFVYTFNSPSFSGSVAYDTNRMQEGTTILYTSPWLTPPQSFSGAGSLIVNCAPPARIDIQGTNDGIIWQTFYSYIPNGQYISSLPFNLGSDSYQQIRVVMTHIGGNNYIVEIANNYSLSINVYSLVADQQTAQQAANNAAQARDAANATVQYAQNAQAAAQAAQSAAQQVNTIVNSTLTVNAGVVQDSSGTVLTAARAAQAAAQNAVTGIQDTQNKLDNLQTTITNNFNNLQNYLPPTFLKISGYQGATATSASTFRVALDYSNATDYRIAVDGNWGPWSSLSSYESTGYVTATGLNTPGVHQITVELRNGQNGPTVQRSMSVFKL